MSSRSVKFPKLPAIPRQSKYINLPAEATPNTLLPKTSEEDRYARWQEFSGNDNASYPEFIVMEYLTRVRRMRRGVDFIFQYGISGGRSFLGGQVVDFYLPFKQHAWLVQGLRFHYVTPEQRKRDTVAKLVLVGMGLTVIELFEDDIIEHTVNTIEQALNGIQVSRGSLDG